MESLVLRVPADWLPAIDARARAAGQTRNAYLQALLLADQPAAVRRALSPLRPRGRPRCPKSAD